MDEAEVFNEYVTGAGRRRLDRSALPPGVAEAYDSYLARARAAVAGARRSLPTLPEVYTDFVTHPSFNAFAFRHRDHYCIAFHEGLLVVLAGVTARMLADRHLFPRVGDPGAEVENLPHLNLATPSAASLARANPAAVVPQDPSRRGYALHLCQLAFEFLAAHEVAHITGGHVDYRKAERGIPHVGEVEWLPGTARGNMELQAMELDADATAASVVVRTVLSRFDSRGQATSGNPDDRNPTDALFDVALAVCIMFRLFPDSRMNGVDLSRNSHPPVRWRQMHILNMMGNHVAGRGDETLVRSVEAAFTRAVAEVEEAFERITGSGQQIQGLHDAWHGDGWAYAATVADCWNSAVRGKVAKYAFIAPNGYHFEQPPPRTG